jgi:GT2 family glycosyltransferase
MKTGVIIVTYNGEKFIKSCVETLTRQTDGDFVIFIVDNASVDNTVQTVKELQEKSNNIILMQNGSNLGFSKANNIGIKKALENGVENIFLLNQDTEISKNCIEELKKAFMIDKNVGSVCPKIYEYHDRTIWWDGTVLLRGIKLLFCPTIKVWVIPNKGCVEIGKKDIFVNEIEISNGCAWMIKKEIFQKIGLLPEDFKFYGEDSAYSIKVKNAGYKQLCVNSASVYHKTKYSRMNRSLSKIMQKHILYFLGTAKIVYRYFTLYEKIIWTVKLPITIPVTFVFYIIRDIYEHL